MRSIDPRNLIVAGIPFRELWDPAGNVPAQRVRDLSCAQIEALLRTGPVRFVVAGFGFRADWRPLRCSHAYWKSEVKRHLADPEQAIDLARFPGEYCYFASEWRDAAGKPPIVLLQKIPPTRRVVR